jgi:predicted CXXCH cytochrome family protein
MRPNRTELNRSAGARLVLVTTLTLACCVLFLPLALGQKRQVEHPAGGDELCADCHDDLMAGSTQHLPATDNGCDLCHVVEGAADEFTVATDTTDAACLDCHDDISERMTAGNMHPILEDDACTFCHSPHSSDNSKLLLQPMGTLCADCHDVAEQLETMPVVHDVVADEDSCGYCHDAHGSSQPKLLLEPYDSLCGMCHEVAETFADKPVKHAPVADIGCPLCHAPHAGENEHLLPGKINDLCLTCHIAPTEENPGLELAADATYIADTRKIYLDAARVYGHPGLGHPVTDPPQTAAEQQRAEMFPDLNVVPEDRPPLNCASCHNPHASTVPALLRENENLCSECHL